jgi:hypothetical protein
MSYLRCFEATLSPKNKNQILEIEDFLRGCEREMRLKGYDNFTVTPLAKSILVFCDEMDATLPQCHDWIHTMMARFDLEWASLDYQLAVEKDGKSFIQYGQDMVKTEI